MGDIAELGENEKRIHAEVGAFAASLSIDAIYCTGPLFAFLAEAAKTIKPKLDVRHFYSKDQLIVELPRLLEDGDTVLVKASHFMQFNQIVSILAN